MAYKSLWSLKLCLSTVFFIFSSHSMFNFRLKLDSWNIMKGWRARIRRRRCTLFQYTRSRAVCIQRVSFRQAAWPAHDAHARIYSKQNKYFQCYLINCSAQHDYWTPYKTPDFPEEREVIKSRYTVNEQLLIVLSGPGTVNYDPQTAIYKLFFYNEQTP